MIRSRVRDLSAASHWRFRAILRAFFGTPSYSPVGSPTVTIAHQYPLARILADHSKYAAARNACRYKIPPESVVMPWKVSLSSLSAKPCPSASVLSAWHAERQQESLAE